MLEIDGVVVRSKENDLVRDTLLVTACNECNWGRRDALERWDEIATLLAQRVLPGRATRVRFWATPSRCIFERASHNGAVQARIRP